eukprot:TRINITY_DN17550_c0_g1_i1.p1 TRINITY_DN17550_c0_g1~~TRINITY_DN17550_c0_g1_i1.p1  ORF type:complete len:120 (+),score=9.26 TRINITY_DN17550_c0_g1_i1:41-400(+)
MVRLSFLAIFSLVALSVVLAEEHTQASRGLKCIACKWVMNKILEDTVVKFGCKGGDVAFEGACNAAGDLIPGIGEGPWETICTIATAVVSDICDHEGDKYIKDHLSSVDTRICDKVHLC